MSDLLIKTGDMLQVTVTPPAVVPQLISPSPLLGTGMTVLVDSQPVCLQGDELPVALRLPLTYMAPPFTIPGMGTLMITLLPNNLTLRTTVSGKPALLKGATFTATFNVTVPAMQPTPVGPIPDPVIAKPCQAQFITTTVNASAA